MLTKNFSLIPATLSLKRQYPGSFNYYAGQITKLFKIHYDIITLVNLIVKTVIGG